MAASFPCSDPLSLLLFVLVILVSTALPSSTLFQSSSGPGGAISQQEGNDVYLALNKLVANIDTSQWYDSGVAFANALDIHGTLIAIRYVRWTQYCTVGTWESAAGGLLLEDFRTTVPYLRPYLLQGCSWAAVSNGYAWIDYYIHESSTLLLPSELQAMNASNADQSFSMNASNPKADQSFFSSSGSTVSRYSPVDKTGFVDCPVLPLVLLSHINGIWDVLRAGEYLTSANKRIQLAMQEDCNLVLTDRENNLEMWSSNTAGNGEGCFLRLQTEANLVIYNRDGVPVWAINQLCGEQCEKFSSLVIEDDGNLVVYRSENGQLSQVWATNTKV